jgi:hypothetical protein
MISCPRSWGVVYGDSLMLRTQATRILCDRSVSLQNPRAVALSPQCSKRETVRIDLWPKMAAGESSTRLIADLY